MSAVPAVAFRDGARRGGLPRRDAAAAGLPVSEIPMPIDWDFALAETRGEMKAASSSARSTRIGLCESLRGE
ncbi:hypothetical protein [Nocardia grenadensis]|uniref:hypothetical protein n=1 Tax=Nocardia grenadensis TaxID=931537 RepID=UPI003D931E49